MVLAAARCRGPTGLAAPTHPPAPVPCSAPRLAAVPALLPAALPGPVLCSLLGFCRSGGEGWGRRGENIAEGQKRNGERFLCLHPLHAPRSLPPGAVCHVLCVSVSQGRRAVSLASNLCCSPRWEKPELTRKRCAEAMLSPSIPELTKRFPTCSFCQMHLVGLPGRAPELLIQADARSAHHFPLCIATSPPQKITKEECSFGRWGGL